MVVCRRVPLFGARGVGQGHSGRTALIEVGEPRGNATPLGGGGGAVVECDQVGQPRLAVDRAGALVWEGAFDAWGGAVDAGGAVEIDLRFPGQVADAETGLRYNRHRYYDPATRTYGQSDPTGLRGGLRPQGYVKSPLQWVDVLGLGGCNWKKKRPADGPHYSVAYEANLERGVDYPGRSDRHHFSQSNRQLHEPIQGDPEFANAMESLYPGVSEHVAPGPRGGLLAEPPQDLTWHHHPDREGVMQLVLREHRRAPGAVQELLHPNQRGGMENWGGGRSRGR